MAALTSTHVSALSLGAVQGAAFVGRLLDVSVPVQFAADEDVASHCFSADVSYGELPLPSDHIAVQVQPGQHPNTQLVRIRSNERVNEAVVTLNLLAVCGPRVSRRYVLLSDIPDETGATRMSGPSTRVVSAAENPSAVVAEPAHPPRFSIPQGAQKKNRGTEALSAGSAPTEHPVGSQAANQEKMLPPYESKRPVSASDTGQTANDAAEVLRKSEAHTQVLEADIKQLQIASTREQKKLQALAATLERTLSGNDSRTQLYVLGGLLVACLGVIAYAIRAKFLVARTHTMPQDTKVLAPNADIDLDLGWNLDFGSGADPLNKKTPKA